ncbi:MAG: sulfatase activating formylglycine-generating enzyme [Glaciecola sp.]|jgi:formylglycine-generating enzyme required for sulfatase activity
MRFFVVFTVLFFYLPSNGFSQKSSWEINESSKKNVFIYHVDTFNAFDFHSNHRSFFQFKQTSDKVPVGYYSGSAFKKDPKGFVYFNPGLDLIKHLTKDSDERNYRGVMLKNAVRYNLDTVKTPYCTSLELQFDVSSVNFDELYTPFYFSKNEVTNAEYKEFLNCILDSLFKMELGGDFIKTINGKKIVNRELEIDMENENVIKRLAKFYLEPGEERFYKRKQLDSKIYKCRYDGRRVSVYPDTLSWVHDFFFSYNELMTQMYFWHPTYDQYPVVGINYWQARCFLNWKEKQLREELKKAGSKLKIEIDFPTLQEREYVLEDAYDYTTDEEESNYVADNSFITDIALHYDDISRKTGGRYSNGKESALREVLYRNSTTPGNYILDGSLHTIPSYKFLKGHSRDEKVNSKAVEFLGNNVSEWTNYPYSKWKKIFELRQNTLLATQEFEDSLVSAIERFYDRKNDELGVLIVGGNWSDEKHSLQLGQNLDGAYAKRFIHPDSSYSTVGFRYVVRVMLPEDSISFKVIKNKTEESESFTDANLVEDCSHWEIMPDTSEISMFIKELTLKYSKEPCCDEFCKMANYCDRSRLYLNLHYLLPDNEGVLDAVIPNTHYRMTIIDDETVKLIPSYNRNDFRFNVKYKIGRE